MGGGVYSGDAGAQDWGKYLAELLGCLALSIIGGVEAVGVVGIFQPAPGVHQVNAGLGFSKGAHHLGDFLPEITAEGMIAKIGAVGFFSRTSSRNLL